MAHTAYRLVENDRPTLGLVVLHVDETIEDEFRHLIAADEARLHITRVRSGETLSPESIADMRAELTAAARLLPSAREFDVVGYACTSATALNGGAQVHALIDAGTRTRAVTDPFTAAVEAIRALGLQRIGIVSPYVVSVAAPLCEAFAGEGIRVEDIVSFGEDVEARVARIDPASIADAARSLAGRSRVDGIFLSCTNLRTLSILPTLEAELGLPVLSSNQVLAWHMRKLAGIDDHSASPGRSLRLFGPQSESQEGR